MRPIEELDLGTRSDPQLVVMASKPGELVGDPLGRCSAVESALLDHEWTRCHQHRQLGVAGHVAHVPFGDLVLAREDVVVAGVVAGDRADPVGEVGRADGQRVFADKGWNPHRGLPAVGESVEGDPTRVDLRQCRQPPQCLYVLRDDVAVERAAQGVGLALDDPEPVTAAVGVLGRVDDKSSQAEFFGEGLVESKCPRFT